MLFFPSMRSLGKLSNISPEDLNHVHSVVSSIQSAVYDYEGSLNKFLVDDKGGLQDIVCVE